MVLPREELAAAQVWDELVRHGELTGGCPVEELRLGAHTLAQGGTQPADAGSRDPTVELGGQPANGRGNCTGGSDDQPSEGIEPGLTPGVGPSPPLAKARDARPGPRPMFLALHLPGLIVFAGNSRETRKNAEGGPRKTRRRAGERPKGARKRAENFSKAAAFPCCLFLIRRSIRWTPIFLCIFGGLR